MGTTEKKIDFTDNSPGLLQDIKSLAIETLEKALLTLELVTKYRSYCQQESLCYSDSALSFIYNQVINTITFLKKLQSDNTEENKTKLLIKKEAEIRLAKQSIAAANLYLSWRSPSYSQSMIPQFFDLGNQEGNDIYERYGFKEIRRIEKQLMDLIDLTDKHACTVVNSGMAAYTLIESFLLRNVLKPQDCIIVSPHIYYEIMEQMTSLREWIKVIEVDDYTVESFIKAINKYNPKVIFIEPLANTSDQRMVNINTLLNYCQTLENKPIVIIDSSTMPCSLHFFINNYDNIIYFESCSKYLQFGLDISMAGYLIYKAELMNAIEELRRNMGLILTEYGAHVFPKYDKHTFMGRVKRIEDNAHTVSHRLMNSIKISGLCDIFHTSLESHPDNLLATNMNRYGGCVTLKYKEEKHNNKENFDFFVSLLLKEADKQRLPISTGASYGFSFHRIGIIVLMAKKMGVTPYVRLWVGDQDYNININTADLIADALLQTIKNCPI